MKLLKLAIFREIFLFVIQLSMNKKQALGRILRRACGDYADFSFTESQKALSGYQIKTVHVSSQKECEKRCVNEYKCKSVNLQLNVVNKTCELNSRSAADYSDGVSLTSKPGWMFSSTSYVENLIGHVCKRMKPCPYEHLCIDVCYRPGYKCIHCRQLPQGNICERSIYNIALRKPARQSRTHGDSKTKFTGNYAVDGSHSLYIDDCIFTCPGKNPWWGIDFQGRAVIFAVDIWSRSPFRADGVYVRIGDIDHPHKNREIFRTTAVHHQRKEFATSQKGRYLHLDKRGDGVCLDSCEVKVEGYLE